MVNLTSVTPYISLSILEPKDNGCCIRRDLSFHSFGFYALKLTIHLFPLHSDFFIRVARRSLKQGILYFTIDTSFPLANACIINGCLFFQSLSVERLTPMLWAICSSISPSRAQPSILTILPLSAKDVLFLFHISHLMFVLN